jgi:hypothetical protein
MAGRGGKEFPSATDWFSNETRLKPGCTPYFLRMDLIWLFFRKPGYKSTGLFYIIFVFGL